jgi:hypothetical protein
VHGDFNGVRIRKNFKTREGAAAEQSILEPKAGVRCAESRYLGSLDIRRNALAPVEMAATLDAIRTFAWPVMEAAVRAAAFNQHWSPATGWHPHVK